MLRWSPKIVAVKPAANDRLPVSRARGEVSVEVVGGYRRVVLAASARATCRRGTFFTTSG